MNINGYLSQVDRRKFTNNNQKVLYRLLRADGKWVSGSELKRLAPSAGSRIRDLRKTQFGSFSVECLNATELGKRGDGNKFFYRIAPRTVQRKQVEAVFRQ